MKVLFDDKIFSTQKYGGVSKYFCEMIKRLPKGIWETSALFTNNEYVRNSHLFPYISLFPKSTYRGQSRIPEILNMPITQIKLEMGNFDIFHQTDFASYNPKYLKNKKMVITFHDMNYVKYRELYNNIEFTNRRESLQKECLKRADQIIAISHTTKKDLIDLWNIAADKITVIHHGVNKNSVSNLNPNRIIQEPYILFVGERYGFKNFSRLLKAFAILEKSYPELRLMCTSVPLSNTEQTEIQELRLSQKVIHISADEPTMARLYRDAELFVYPSFSEGFGMPILESMVYDCPVVLSRASCFPEIAGNSAQYFDPFDEEDIAFRIDQVLSSESAKNELISQGRSKLNEFSWEKSAGEHLSVYQSLV